MTTDSDVKPGVVWGLVAAIAGVWLLSLSLDDAPVSAEITAANVNLVEVIAAGALLGAPVPILVGAFSADDATVMSKLAGLGRLVLAFAMGAIAGIAVIAAGAATDNDVTLVAVLLAAATRSAGALRVARVLVGRADGVITVVGHSGETARVPAATNPTVKLGGAEVTTQPR